MFLPFDPAVMTEQNDEIRPAAMAGGLPSHPSATSLVNQDLSRNISADSTNEFELSVSSNSILNDTTQSTDSNSQNQLPPLHSSESNNSLAYSVPPTSSEAVESSAGPQSFAQLAYQKFETIIHETRADQIVPPIQEMISGYGEGLARLAQSTQNQLQMAAHYQLRPPAPPQQHPPQGQFLEPIALRRNIHSTPVLRRTPESTLSVIKDGVECDFDSDEESPPPAGLDIIDLTRSQSTPLSTSENSAFGTIPRTNSFRASNSPLANNESKGGSAFSLRPYAMKKSNTRSNERASRPVIFNPIVHEDEVLKTEDGEDLLTEMTAIEVTNVPLPEETKEKEEKKKMMTTISQILAEVRNLRIGGNGNKRLNGIGRGRKNRPRDGRENPAQPASVSSDEQSRASTIGSGTTNANDRKDTIRPVIVAVSTTSAAPSVSTPRAVSSLDTIDNSTIQDSSTNERVHIQVDHHVVDTIDIGHRQVSVSSPEPSVLDQSDIPDSPTSTRFPPSISNSSGRVSYVTSTSSNGRSHASHLSSISETDREVANVNLLLPDRGPLQIVGEQIELSLASDRSIRSRDLNGSLNGSISVDSNIRRDGASVRADRFFNYRKDLNRLRHLQPFNRRSSSANSPTTGSCSASVNTNSTSGSDEPPKIVSYMDKKTISDLSSLYHHRQYPYETSSPRADHDKEVRDSSPSEHLTSEIIFEGAHPAQIDCRPRPFSVPATNARKNRSRPPRSPLNHLSSTTPPPRVGSPVYNAMSPPRHIVGHPMDPVPSNLPMPQVVAPTSYRKPLTPSPPITEQLADANQGLQENLRSSPNCDYYNLKPAARGISPVCGHQGGRTYEENSIEILKTDSKDEGTIPLVTPDKGNTSAC